MVAKVARPEAYRLFHEGAIALSRVEQAGMKVDEAYLDRAIKKTRRTIKDAEAELRADPIFRQWRNTFGSKTNLNANDQLAKVIFGVVGYPSKEYEKAKKEGVRPKADEAAFRHCDLPFVRNYFICEKSKKALGTYLGGIRRECSPDGFVHAFINLNTAVSYRSSIEDPSLQNMPIRDPAMSRLIRRCFIPRLPGWRLVEVDFSGIEVRVAACYNKDPKLIQYIKDPTTDMHRDMAMQCYKLKLDEVTKNARYCAKNKFVFPEFYGDWWLSCAESLWEAIGAMKLETAAGVGMKEHLKSKGISGLGDWEPKDKGSPAAGTFQAHLKAVEEDFWGNRFSVYSNWKERIWKQYQKEGGFDFFTGFRCNGFFDRKQVTNLRIQGAAFHCLLQSLIELDRRLRKKKMRSKIICQIHDSIIGDCPDDEADEFSAMAKNIMTKWLPALWKWIIVPLEVEVEWTPLGGSWYDKKPVHI